MSILQKREAASSENQMLNLAIAMEADTPYKTKLNPSSHS